MFTQSCEAPQLAVTRRWTGLCLKSLLQDDAPLLPWGLLTVFSVFFFFFSFIGFCDCAGADGENIFCEANIFFLPVINVGLLVCTDWDSGSGCGGSKKGGGLQKLIWCLFVRMSNIWWWETFLFIQWNQWNVTTYKMFEFLWISWRYRFMWRSWFLKKYVWIWKKKKGRVADCKLKAHRCLTWK